MLTCTKSRRDGIDEAWTELDYVPSAHDLAAMDYVLPQNPRAPSMNMAQSYVSASAWKADCTESSCCGRKGLICARFSGLGLSVEPAWARGETISCYILLAKRH